MKSAHRLPRLCLALILGLLALTVVGTTYAKSKNKQEKEAVAALPAKYQQWLKEVQYLISESEKELFLALDKDYQRDAFIERFWKVRDPYPGTARNELREDYSQRLIEAKQFGDGEFDDRARVLLTNGYPLQRIVVNCKPYLVPIEVWYYDGSDTVNYEFLLMFYQRWGAGRFRIWEPLNGLTDLALEGGAPVNIAGPKVTVDGIRDSCRKRDADALLSALSFMRAQGGQLGSMVLISKVVTPSKAPKQEWVATFATYTTDLPENAELFEASLEVDFPGKNQNRTIMQGAIGVPVANVGTQQLGEANSYNMMLTGEILLGEKLFDTFRYNFNFPVEEISSDQLPLLFQRYLRPGEYTLMTRVEDLATGSFYRDERPLVVPILDDEPREPSDPRTAQLLREANQAINSGETTVKIAALPGEWQTGLVRIDALTTGDGVDHVRFMVDNQALLTKKSPPFNVELDLGNVPRSRVVRVEALDAEGVELAADEIMINAGDHRFAVRLMEPRRGKTYNRSLRAQADVIVPKTEVVERVEFFLNEAKVSTLYQPPWIQPIVLPEEQPVAYVRAVAYTPDGNATEDLVFINAPDNLEEIDIDFVELYTAVLDRNQRPVKGLNKDDFAVFEDEVPQQVVRFDLVENLPIHAAIMLDVSASMAEELDQAREAATYFFEQALTPKDRATAVTFNDHPNLVTEFTNDVKELAGGLTGLKAERGTALYDSLIFTLYYFNGISGQRAIILLSDGKDESSRFEYRDALEYARRAGVSIYAIGLQIPRGQIEARRNLNRFADETGGRAFFIEDVAELTSIYDTIQQEMRSRYLIAYQSSNTADKKSFRSIEVKTRQSGQEVKTLRGYYP